MGNGLSSGIRSAIVDSMWMGCAILVIALAVWIFGGNAAQRVVTHAAIMLTGVLALQIFSGNTGIVSFGHAGFMGVGAYAIGILTMSAALQAATLRGLPAFMGGHELALIPALGVAALLGLILGAIGGAPFLRLSGSSASIATLALLIIIYTVLTGARDITRGSQPFYGVPRNVGLWAAIAIAVGTLALARIFREAPWGLAARAAANDEQGAASVGVDRRVVVFAAWTLSTMIACVAGGLMAQFLGAFTPHAFYFDLAFTMLAMLIVGGMSSSLGALAGVIVTTLIIELVRRVEGGGELFGITLPSVFGLTQAVLAIGMILIIWRRPEGLFGTAEANVLRTPRSTRANARALAKPPKVTAVAGARSVEPHCASSDAEPVQGAAAPSPIRDGDARSITLEGLTKRYAGVTAVDSVSLEILPDSITGLIGPNGAGKTTLLNIIAGQTAPTGGRVRIGSSFIEGAAPHVIARAGVGRTFQNGRVFSRMTVLENVLVAARRVEPNLAAAEQVALRELAHVGLEAYADRPAHSLAFGLRRRLEIARALALRPAFLLLDEPAAGMNPVETRDLTQLLARARAERGLGIVLIEHDLQLVMSLCQRIFVLDQGKLIASGTPAEVQANPAVIAAYLGSRVAAKVSAYADGNRDNAMNGATHA